MAFVLLVAAWLLLRGKTGRALRAIRDSEIAAASSGVNLALYKTLAFGISAFYAGVAGSLYVIAHGYMNPDVFPIILSVYLVAALAIGGADSLPGLLVGAGVLYVLDYRADDVTRWVDHLPAVHLNPQRLGMSSVIFGARGKLVAPAAGCKAVVDIQLHDDVVFVPTAGAGPLATPGVSSTEIRIGSSVPLSGEAALAGNVARGIDAYLKYVDAKGGVYGRKIKYVYLDDGYDPGRAVNNTIRLVQQEQVFAVFSSLGTSNNLAVRKLLNDAKVPQLFVSSGATTFGRDYKKPSSTRTTTTAATCSPACSAGSAKRRAPSWRRSATTRRRRTCNRR